MLFAVDLDGTIATIQGTDAYGEYIRSVLGIPIDPAWRHLPSDSSLMAALSRDPAFASWIANEARDEQVHAILKAGQYSQQVQERSRPIAGAKEALSQLAREHDVLYITNRKNATHTLTCSWLKAHGFPNHEHLYCCGDDQGLISKIRYAVSALHSIYGEEGQLVFIDDQAPYFEHAFAALVKEDRPFVKRCIHRLAVIAYGKRMLPPCHFPRPVFPMAPMPEWRHLSETLEALSPYIGGGAALFDRFFEETFVPGVLRRRRNPRIAQHALSA